MRWLLAIAMCSAVAAPIGPVLAESPAIFSGQTCSGWFKNPRTEAADARGAVVFNFTAAILPNASVWSKLGQDAQMAPWNGAGTRPQDYANVGTTSPVQGAGPFQFNATWKDRLMQWVLTPAGHDRYVTTIFLLDKQNPAVHLEHPLASGELSCNAILTELGTCNGEQHVCTAFCTEPNNVPQCHADCNQRLSECMSTGTYRWINSPTKTGLERR